MNILFLIGSSAKFKDNNSYPFYLTEISKGKTFLEKRLEDFATIPSAKFIFVVHDDNIKDFKVDDIIKLVIPECIIISVYSETSGSACSAMLAVKYIDNKEPLLILSIDDIILENNENILNNFINKDFDAGTVIFNSLHPRYSFLKLDDNSKVTEVAEKRPISRNAIASFYYFKHGSEFVWATKEMIKKDAKVDGKFFISPVLNQLILKHSNIGIYKIETNNFVSIKDEEQFKYYISQINIGVK